MAKLNFLKAQPLSLQILALMSLLSVGINLLTLTDTFLVKSWLLPTILSFGIGGILLIEANYKIYLKSSGYKNFNFKDGINVLTVVVASLLIGEGFVGVSLIQANLATGILEFFKQTSMVTNVSAGVLFIYHMLSR